VNQYHSVSLMNLTEHKGYSRLPAPGSMYWPKACYFVDELSSSLHPLIVRFLIGLIQNPEINKHNAQLIFTTHDTSVLDSDILRRDQVWFVEKDGEQASKLYPLSDFTPRKGEALEKGYLKGRYGALPFIGELRF